MELMSVGSKYLFCILLDATIVQYYIAAHSYFTSHTLVIQISTTKPGKVKCIRKVVGRQGLYNGLA